MQTKPVAELEGRSASQLLHDHRAALAAGEIDRAVLDYAEDAIVLTDGGADRGHDQIRRSLTRLLEAMGDAWPRVTEEAEIPLADGRTTLVRVKFTIDGPDLQVADGCDVYVVRDGQIVAQTAHLGPAVAASGGEHSAGTGSPPAAHPATVAEALVATLERAGVSRVFGIVGGPCGPLYDALARSGMDLVQARHESGAVFAALEHHLVTGTPGAALVTTGPGFLNALNAVAAARWDGARFLLLSATTAVPQWGRGAAQETSPYTALQGLMYDRGLFDLAVPLLGEEGLSELERRLVAGLSGPGRFIAHVSVPTSVQTAPAAKTVASAPPAAVSSSAPPSVSSGTIHRTADLLREQGFAIWVGAGARTASAQVRVLAERTGVGVLCSPRGKGIFPETHPQFVGVTGLGGHGTVGDFLRAERPGRLLVLGSRLGEVTSLWDPELIPEGGLVHVDLDPTAFGAAYPQAPTFGIQADIGCFLAELLPHLSPSVPAQRRRLSVHPPATPIRDDGLVRPQALMDAVQKVVVEGSDAIVMSESGSAFSWTNHHLRFDRPGQYRVSMTWASMGHMTCGVVGAALGRCGVAVAIVGDGAMLMGQEISTAVATGACAVWIVLNDARQGIVAQAMEMQGLSPSGTEIPRVDFVAMARALGAGGESVGTERQLVPALERAISADCPWVLDVAIDRRELSPMLQQRVASLRMQGASRGAGS